MSEKPFIKLLSPGDILPVLVIIAGIVLIITIDEPAIQIIGLGLSVLVAIYFYVELNKRKRDLIQSKFKQKVPPPNFKVTVQENQDSKKTTFDNFKESIDELEKDTNAEEKINTAEISSDEGFRIIKKGNKTLEEKKPEPKAEKISEIEDVTEEVVEEKIEEEPFKMDFHLESLMDSPPSKADGPRKEFEYLLTRILITIRAINNTCTTAFFIFNPEKKEIRLESYASSIPDNLNKDLKYKLGNDVVSSVIENGNPEIVSDINPASQKELIPYYKVDSKISSFVGVPVYYQNVVIGVLTADSSESDSFDSVMVNFLGQYNKLISSLLTSYSEKYDLIEAQKSLNAIKKFDLASNHDEVEIISNLIEIIEDSIHFDYASLISFDDDNNSWLASSEINKSERSGINGLLFGSDSNISASINKKEAIVGESSELTPWLPKWAKYYWNIPIATENISFGSILFIFEKEPEFPEELETAKTLANLSSISLEKIQLTQMLDSGSIIDFTTGITNSKVFNLELEKEFERTKQFNRNLSFCLIHIDKYSSFEGQENQEKMNFMVRNVLGQVSEFKRNFDLLGVFEEEIYGVTLPEMNSDNAKIWAEKLRSTIATSMIEIDKKRFNATVSVGVANSRSSDNLQEFVANAKKALQISQEKTNQVSLFG